MYDIPFDRSILQLSNGIRHVMPSTDRKLELAAKASMAQPVSQPAVCSNGLIPLHVPVVYLTDYCRSLYSFEVDTCECGDNLSGSTKGGAFVTV
jgi:hypothetical protein